MKPFLNNRILEALKAADSIFLCTHIAPDGDAIGSLLATKLLLEGMGKKVTACCADPVPKRFLSLPGAAEIVKPEQVFADFDLAMSLPDTVLQIMVSDYDKRFPVTENDFSGALFYKLHSCYTKALQEYGDRETARKKALTGFLDINEELSSRLLSIYKEASSFSDLCGKVKSKDLTYTRISRAAMHIILDISAANMKEYIADDYNYYARILGFRSGESTASLLHGLKQSSALPLITKLADADKILTGRNARRLLSEEIQASDLYERTACMKYHGLFRSEYVRNIVKY